MLKKTIKGQKNESNAGKGTKGQVTPDLPKTRKELYKDLKDLLVMDNHREATKHGKVQMVSL